MSLSCNDEFELELCRVCLNSYGDMQPIFESEKTITIAQMLTEVTIYKVQRLDNLPHLICSQCLEDVVAAYKLKQLCELSYRKCIQMMNDEKGDIVMMDLNSKEQVDSCTQTDDLSLYPCERCDEKFSTNDALRYHRTNDHEGIVIICRFCSRPFDRIGALKIHIDVSHPESRAKSHNQCRICKRAFTRREHMRRHMAEIHKIVSIKEANSGLTEEKPLPNNSEDVQIPQEIGQDYTDLLDLGEEVNKDVAALDDDDDNLLEELIKNDTNMQTLAEKIIEVTTPGEEQPTNISGELTNIVEKNKTNRVDKLYDPNVHICPKCSASFSTENSLQKHLERHEKWYDCKECSQKFASRAELKDHVKIEGHDKPLLCPECGLRCKESNSLMVHMRRHNGEKPFKCKFCSKGFPRINDLSLHEKYHTGEKSHFCETCGKGFQRKYGLTIHLRVHTGEKPYKCPHCTQAFTQANDLKAHIRRHTGERFRCEMCNAAFLKAYQIRQHKLQEHGIHEVPPTQRVKKFISPEEQEKQIQKNIETI